MSIEHAEPIDNLLTQRCAGVLESFGIEPFGDRSLYWMISGELDDEYLRPFDGTRTIFGYPVHVEWLVGEETIVLMETIAIEHVPLPDPKDRRPLVPA